MRRPRPSRDAWLLRFAKPHSVMTRAIFRTDSPTAGYFGLGICWFDVGVGKSGEDAFLPDSGTPHPHLDRSSKALFRLQGGTRRLSMRSYRAVLRRTCSVVVTSVPTNLCKMIKTISTMFGPLIVGFWPTVNVALNSDRHHALSRLRVLAGPPQEATHYSDASDVSERAWVQNPSVLLLKPCSLLASVFYSA